LPGLYYRQVFDWLFRENRLAAGTFPARGRAIDPRKLKRPLFPRAGTRDVIAPPAQVFAVATLVDTHESDIEKALTPCGHLALLMGQRTLAEE
jgi:poly(3-hydroxyalkanoate) synthetase